MTLCGPTAKPRPSTSSLLWLYLCCDEDDGILVYVFFFSSRRRHTRWNCDWSSDVCYSDLQGQGRRKPARAGHPGPEVQAELALRRTPAGDCRPARRIEGQSGIILPELRRGLVVAAPAYLCSSTIRAVWNRQCARRPPRTHLCHVLAFMSAVRFPVA